jgi:hypothetical protein
MTMNVKAVTLVLALIGAGQSMVLVAAQDRSARNLAAPMQSGELRLDGRVAALKGETAFVMEAHSFTSPNGRTVKFNKPKNKEIHLDEDVLVQERQSGKALRLDEIKAGIHLGALGRDQGSGTPLVARVVWVSKAQ